MLFIYLFSPHLKRECSCECTNIYNKVLWNRSTIQTLRAISNDEIWNLSNFRHFLTNRWGNFITFVTVQLKSRQLLTLIVFMKCWVFFHSFSLDLNFVALNTSLFVFYSKLLPGNFHPNFKRSSYFLDCPESLWNFECHMHYCMAHGLWFFIIELLLSWKSLFIGIAHSLRANEWVMIIGQYAIGPFWYDEITNDRQCYTQ